MNHTAEIGYEYLGCHDEIEIIMFQFYKFYSIHQVNLLVNLENKKVAPQRVDQYCIKNVINLFYV